MLNNLKWAGDSQRWVSPLYINIDTKKELEKGYPQIAEKYYVTRTTTTTTAATSMGIQNQKGMPALSGRYFFISLSYC